MIRFTFILIFLFGSLTSFKKELNFSKYPTDYFSSPVATEITLSGTFGELRPNHLHAGIDIKAFQGKTGQDIFAVADGFVSRINVASGGYGKAIYIDHPNGYTSVYAHLKNFNPELEAYMKQQQYQAQEFEITRYPNPEQFIFSQGQKIGTLGLSGRSFGPHLHFEIRDTRSEHPINPLLFGFKVKDSIKPIIQGIKSYSLNESLETISEKRWNALPAQGKYTLSKDTLTIPSWRVGFALESYDQMNGAGNLNGIYALEMYVDDSLYYSFDMEKFSFDESRYINAHLDYKEQISLRDYFNRCFSLPGNKLSIYNQLTNNGVVELSVHKRKKIRFEVTDVDRNMSTLEFWVKRSEVELPDSKVYTHKVFHNQDNLILGNGMEMHFPQGALYEHLYLNYQSTIDSSLNTYSAVHHIHDYKTPVHKYIDLSIKPDEIPLSKHSKAFIAYRDKKGNYSNCGGTWTGTYLTTKVRALGEYCIMVDDEAPSIKQVKFPKKLKAGSKISFKIQDNFATARNVKGLRFECRIDGAWVLMEFDGKKDLLYHYIDKDLSKGVHQFQLTVTDALGNGASFEKSFEF